MSLAPSIACIGFISKYVNFPESHFLRLKLTTQDNPLHISIFEPHSAAKGAFLEFSFLLNASLDIFELRTNDRNRVDQDLGMLQAVDERLSIWGWQTGTGTRIAVIVDMWGKQGRPSTGPGIKSEDLKPVRGIRCSDYSIGWKTVTKRPWTGFQSTANRVHTPATEPILYARQSYANSCN